MSNIIDADHPAIKTFSTLASPIRFAVLATLAKEERLAVSELQEKAEKITGQPSSQSAFSQHLAVLRNKGLVATERDSTRIYYRLQSEPVRDALHLMRSAFAAA